MDTDAPEGDVVFAKDGQQLEMHFPYTTKERGHLLAQIIEAHPEEAIAALLSGSWWPRTLSTKTLYHRFEDDTRFGGISIVMSDDADAWIEIISDHDPDDITLSRRFRVPFIGGGQSHHVRNALLVLAEAIRLDNEEHPQHRNRS